MAKANYTPALKSTRVKTSSFGVHEEGFSFTFRHNWNDWKTYAEEQKIAMSNRARRAVAAAARFVADEAIKRCPHYSGAMERAIRVSDAQPTRMSSVGRIAFAVGVLSSWKSSYDEKLGRSSLEYAQASGPELAAYIHEMYDEFIYRTDEKGEYRNKGGIARKRRKEAASGERVGSFFLLRAFTENRDVLRDTLDFRKGLHGVGAGMSLDDADEDRINALLDASSAKFDRLYREDEYDI